MENGESDSNCKYRFNLPELVRSKDRAISLDLLHGLYDVLSFSVHDFASHSILDFELLRHVQIHQIWVRVRYIIPNDGPLGNMHRR